MPSVVHAPLINTAPPFLLRERTAEPLASAFTAVNGRTSPPTPRKLNGIHSMPPPEPIRLSPINSPEQTQDQKLPLNGRDDWSSVSSRPVENGHHSKSPSSSPDTARSPTSPGKRKRLSSVEEDRLSRSPEDGSTASSRRRLNSYVSSGREDSTHPASQLQALNMEHPQHRTLPPMDRAESDRIWSIRDSQELQQSGYPDSQHRDPRAVDPSQESMNLNSASQPSMSSVGEPNGVERPGATEITRAGVQVDPKKQRKRQFANRTKTGCGTCRRRKKKCDEAKPECNNCQRGGFICEGYANKVPWPKNGGPAKPHPPLQAKDRFPVDPAQLYHNHGTGREPYPEPPLHNGTDGARARPIVVEEHERAPTRNGWGNGWSEPPRASYPPEPHHPTPEYSHAPSTATTTTTTTPHSRPSSNDHQVPLPIQGPPAPRQHNPRIYHHTPQTMSQVVGTSPAVTAEAPMHHQPQPPHSQPPMPPPTAGPPAPPPSHYAPAPPRPQKTEKEKMLNEEPFKPFDDQLIEDRDGCKGHLFRYNNTSNSALTIAGEERSRLFRAVLGARWTSNYRGRETPMMGGHLGHRVFVDTPFMCDYGYNISIADGVEIGTGCKFLDSGRITVGRNTTIGANVTIDTQKMPTDHKSLKGSGRTVVASAVHIGENVHIGANSTILAGVKIGTGAIVHAGSVVVRDVPRDVVVRGNPAEVRMVHWED